MDPFAFALSLCCAAATEAAWRAVRAETAAARVPDRATLARWLSLNEQYRGELEHRHGLPFTAAALRDAQDRAAWLSFALLAYDEPDPWRRLGFLHEVRARVGDGAFYNGGWPAPVPVNAVPWYSGGRGVLVGVPKPDETGDEP